MANQSVGWQKCIKGGCVGVCLATGGECWAHAAKPDLQAALKQLGVDGCLDARGVPITQKLLACLLAAAPQDDQGHVVLTEARFDQATFQGDADFLFATFQNWALFNQATFQGRAPAFSHNVRFIRG